MANYVCMYVMWSAAGNKASITSILLVHYRIYFPKEFLYNVSPNPVALTDFRMLFGVSKNDSLPNAWHTWFFLLRYIKVPQVSNMSSDDPISSLQSLHIGLEPQLYIPGIILDFISKIFEQVYCILLLASLAFLQILSLYEPINTLAATAIFSKLAKKRQFHFFTLLSTR